ncbi:MAG: AMP-binding protein [Tepidisphaeraceae bacterium]
MTHRGLLVERFRENAASGRVGRMTFLEEDVVMSHTQLWQRSARVATALAERGVAPGHRVGLAMHSTPETVVAFGAILQLGAALVPLRTLSSRDGGRDADAVAASVRAGRVRLCLVPRASRPAHASRIADVDVVAIEDVLGTACPPYDYDPAVVTAADVLLVQFSSGTIDAPTGICLTQANVAANLAAATARMGVDVNERILSWLPLFHDLGLIGHLCLSLYTGCDLIHMRPRAFMRDPLAWIVELSKHRATFTSGPQFAYDLCRLRSRAAWERVQGSDLTDVRAMVNGAEMISPASCRRFEEQFGRLGLRANVIVPAYGLAENCVLVTARAPGTRFPVRRLDRRALDAGEVRIAEGVLDVVDLAGHGTPAQGIEVRVCSADGTVVAPGRIGEILIGGTSAAAVVAEPDGSTRPLSEDGFIRTGDLGAFIDGELYLVGRTREILRHGSRAYAPADIEWLLLGCPGVVPAGAAAISISNPGTGDELVVIVEAIAVADLRDLARRVRLALLRGLALVPREVVLVRPATLPRTSSGKLRRVALRDAYRTGRLEQLVDIAFSDRSSA